MSDALVYDREGHVVTLTLNQPETRALTGHSGGGVGRSGTRA